MVRRYRPRDRDRALRKVSLWTAAGIAGAAGLTGAVAALTATSFAAASPKLTPSAAHPVPVEAAPVQSAPPTPLVIVRITHAPAAAGSGSLRPPLSAPTAAPAPAGGGASSAPPPPPPPACHSTPSHPC